MNRELLRKLAHTMLEEGQAVSMEHHCSMKKKDKEMLEELNKMSEELLNHTTENDLVDIMKKLKIV